MFDFRAKINSMFNAIKNTLGLGDKSTAKAADAQGTAGPVSKVSEWAQMQGLSFVQRGDGRAGYHVDGKIGGKPWRLEQGAPSRDFIKGTELRARAELALRDDVVVMVLSRQLKNELEKRAFESYTDDLQTVADPDLPEEMRWLSIYEEVGWESLGKPFLNNYAILADNRDDAITWITPELVQSLMAWPDLDPALPKVLMLRRGKVYLRMQYTDGDMPMLEHATAVFTTACELALADLGTDVSQ
jgi:hypothetical protein